MAVVRPGCQGGDFVVQMSHASLGYPQGLDDPLGSLRGEETSGHTEDKTGLGGMAHLTQQDERLLLNDAGTEARSPSPLTKKLPSAFTSASHATPESPQPSGPDHAPSDLSRLVLGLARRWNGPACRGIPASWRHGPGPPRKLTLNQVTGPHIRDIYMLSSYVCRAETGDPAAANQLARRTDSLLRGDACSNLDRGLRDFRINRLHSRCDPVEPLHGQPAPALRHVWAETSKPSPPKGGTDSGREHVWLPGLKADNTARPGAPAPAQIRDMHGRSKVSHEYEP